ncbi:MAG TPA: hypothetical protein VFP58_15440 [Candidatus Eisenbacteria bacterium]|nr:hypothetical protein [Candidatus Eisenbacteria bacterium]
MVPNVIARLRTTGFLLLLLGGQLLIVTPGHADLDESRDSSFDVSLYLLGAAMTGDVAVGFVQADLNVGFDEIVDHMEFGVMGFGRLRSGHWSFTAEFMYMGLGASKDFASSNFDQWIAEPRIGYRVTPWLEPLAGVRYNSLSGEVIGSLGRNPSGTQDWWDPIVGATATVPVSRAVSLALHGDIGGFGVGSDLTWQAHPYVDWVFMPNASLQAGYRWLDVDYEFSKPAPGRAIPWLGSGDYDFRWDVLTQGPQVGVTVRLR